VTAVQSDERNALRLSSDILAMDKLHVLRETITDMCVSQKILWICRIILELFANLTHKCSQVLKFISVLGSPNRIEESRVLDRLSRVNH
jgi:hypothetical protein